MVHSKSQFIWSSNPDQQSLRLKKKKKHLGLETYQQLWSMISFYLVPPFFGAALLKRSESVFFCSENARNKEKRPLLFEKWSFLDGGFPYFLNKALDKPCNRTYKPS